MQIRFLLAAFLTLFHLGALSQTLSDTREETIDGWIDVGNVTVEVHDLIYAYSNSALWSTRQQKWVTEEEIVECPLPIGIAILGNMVGGGIIGGVAGYFQGGTNGLVIGGSLGFVGGVFGWTLVSGGWGVYLASVGGGIVTGVGASILIDMANGKRPPPTKPK
jgi:hypothetical protein